MSHPTISTGGLPLDVTLAGLRAAAEETRLRVLALLAAGELSVSDLTDILGQSQPRISRHLKLLVEADLIDRHREGAWAFFRLSDKSAARALVGSVLAAVDRDDPRLAEDRARLTDVRAQRAASAQALFARLASRWDEVRSLHVSEDAVEAAILSAIGPGPFESVLDLGTGTGRILQVLAPRAARLVGLDASHAMLAVARANCERAGLAGVDLRQGDIYAPPFARGRFDLVVVHQVLHFLDDPARAIREASHLLAPAGRLLIVDFAPHGLEFLRDTQGHRRLGFAPDQMEAWLSEAGLHHEPRRDLPSPERGADQLTVSLWTARAPRALAGEPIPLPDREVA